MEELAVVESSVWTTVLPGERARLVNLCAYWTGHREAAEDLTRETLIEARRQRRKLIDASGYGRWLSAMARIVCLRWRRAQARKEIEFEGPHALLVRFESVTDPARADVIVARDSYEVLHVDASA